MAARAPLGAKPAAVAGGAGAGAGAGGKAIEEIYQKKTQLEHILLRPDSYSASTAPRRAAPRRTSSPAAAPTDAADADASAGRRCRSRALTPRTSASSRRAQRAFPPARSRLDPEGDAAHVGARRRAHRAARRDLRAGPVQDL
jgi:hypothetical protein